MAALLAVWFACRSQEVDVISPDLLQLSFSNGDALVLTDSEQYESFVIGANNGFMMI